MPLLADRTTFERSLSALPLVTYQAGETLIADGSRTGRLLILRRGAVTIVKGETEIAKVAEPGAVFGELSVLLDQPHTADVIALEASQFHVDDGALGLASLKLALQLNESVIGSVEPVCQHGSNIKNCDRIVREKTGRLGGNSE